MNPQGRPARRFDEVELEDEWLSEKRRDPEIARHSHLGAIVIVAAIVGLALIAVALFVRGAS
jgi:hypothetical protein